MSKIKTTTKRPKLSFKREFSAGGCVCKKLKAPRKIGQVGPRGKQSSKLKIWWLVGKHSGYKKWVLPKGLIEEGEKAQETAVREVEEEMGVKARIVGEKPIHIAKYWYFAKLKAKSQKPKLDSNRLVPERRVGQYQESMGGVEKKQAVRIYKTVKFFLMEYVSGKTEDHSWEMSEAGWFGFDEAMEMLAFPGEREALRQARDKIGQ
jgi:8-oxo-dGTP pyrophosphatase MutT (NUDIX family)